MEGVAARGFHRASSPIRGATSSSFKTRAITCYVILFFMLSPSDFSPNSRSRVCPRKKKIYILTISKQNNNVTEENSTRYVLNVLKIGPVRPNENNVDDDNVMRVHSWCLGGLLNQKWCPDSAARMKPGRLSAVVRRPCGARPARRRDVSRAAR